MKKGDKMSGLGIAMSLSSGASELFAGSSFGRSSEMKGTKMKKLMFSAAVAAGMIGGLQAVESEIVG